MHMAMLRCVLRGPSNAKMFRRRNRDAQPAWDDLGLSNLGCWDGWVHAGWDGWSMVKVKEY